MMKSCMYSILLMSCSMFTYTSDTQVKTLPKVNFVDSLLHVAQYVQENKTVTLTAEQMHDWQMFNPLYDEYILNNYSYDTHARIPKIIHHIWLGSPLPEKFARYRQTWQKMHPDWTCILWDDAKVAKFGLHNLRAYCAATNYGERSDIVRYEVLHRFGGAYVDTDFECLQPFDVLHHSCDFYTGLYPNPGGGPVYILNGIIGSKPGHPILKRCIAGIKTPVKKFNDSSAIMDRTGPSHLGRCITTAIKAGDAIERTVVFPPTFFYPWSLVFRACKNRSETIRNCLRPESLAIHHWAASWTNDFGPASCTSETN